MMQRPDDLGGRSSPGAAQARRLTLSAVSIGILSVALLSFAILWAEHVIKRGSIGTLIFPPVAVAFGVFVFLTIGNRLIWRVRSRRDESMGGRHKEA